MQRQSGSGMKRYCALRDACARGEVFRTIEFNGACEGRTAASGPSRALGPKNHPSHTADGSRGAAEHGSVVPRPCAASQPRRTRFKLDLSPGGRRPGAGGGTQGETHEGRWHRPAWRRGCSPRRRRLQQGRDRESCASSLRPWSSANLSRRSIEGSSAPDSLKSMHAAAGRARRVPAAGKAQEGEEGAHVKKRAS